MQNSLIFNSLLSAFPPFTIDNTSMIFRLNGSLFYTEGTNNMIHVVTATTWTINLSDSWLHSDISGGTGNATSFISVDALGSGSRFGYVYFQISGSTVKQCLITQGNY